MILTLTLKFVDIYNILKDNLFFLSYIIKKRILHLQISHYYALLLIFWCGLFFCSCSSVDRSTPNPIKKENPLIISKVQINGNPVNLVTPQGNVSLNPEITIVFSENMSVDDLRSSNKVFIKHKAEEVNYNVTQGGDLKTISIKPDESLLPNTDYTLEIQKDLSVTIEDKIFILSRKTVFKFTTIANTYEVTFNLNGDGANGSIEKQLISHGKMASKPIEENNPTRLGYTFSTWTTTADATTPFDFINTKIIRKTVIYAKWTINKYKVTFNLNGENTSGSIAIQTVTYNTKATKPDAALNPIRFGYTFDKWVSSDGDTSFNFNTNIIENTIIYAKWKINSYQVRFDLNGEDTIASFEPQFVIFGNLATKPDESKNPTRLGFTFATWVSSPNGNVPFDFLNERIIGDTVIYANWTELPKFIVTFDLNNTPSIDPITKTVIENTKIAPLDPIPTQKGYTFDKWVTTAGGDTAFNFDAKITADVTIYATWIANKIQVSFDLNGEGDSVLISPKSVDYDTLLEKPTPPTSRTHSFVNWFESANPTTTDEPFYFTSTKIIVAITLYAKWSEKPTYIVTFHLKNTPSIDPVTKTVIENTKVTPLIPTPTQTGYTFDKWVTIDGGDIAYNFDIEVTSAFTIFAKWNINSYQVSFDLNGEGDSDPSSPIPVVYNSLVEKPTPPTSRTHSFVNWFESANPTTTDEPFDFTSTKIIVAITLYAKWTEKPTYIVTFDLKNTPSIDPITKTVIENTKVAPLDPIPTQKGYTFDKWVTTDGGDIAFNFDTKITDAITIYAQWTPIKIQVSFDLNGEGNSTPIRPKPVDYNSLVEKPTPPTSRTHSFVNWYEIANPTASDEPFDFTSTKIIASKTLYAKWTEKPTHIVTFDLKNTPSIEPVTKTIIENTKVTPLDPIPTRKGYTFDKWVTTDGGDIAFNFDIKITDAITIYAQWTPIKIQVSFDLNGEGNSDPISPKSVEYDALVNKPTPPTSRTHNFINWYESANPTDTDEPFDFTSTKILATITLYAKWIAKPTFVVTFDLNNTPSIDPITITVVEYTIITPLDPIPTREGYTFDKWVTTDGGDIAFNFDTKITDAITIYAQWTPIKIQVSFDLNGEGNSTPIRPKPVDYNSLVEKPTPPTSRTHSFVNWYEIANPTASDEPFDFTSTKIIASKTLYAKWTEKPTHIVTFDLKNTPSIEPVTKTIIENTKVTPLNPIPIREGYTFDKWVTTDGGDTAFNFDTLITSPITIYAKWIIKTYAVTFDLNGNNAMGHIDIQSIIHGRKVVKPDVSKNPTRIGYTFDKWVTTTDGVIAFDFDNTEIVTTTVIYAKWTAKKLILRFDLNGKGDSGHILPKSVDYDTLAEKPTPPTSRTHNFVDWYESANPSATDVPFDFTSTKILVAKTLFAKWVIKIYPVIFNLNGKGTTRTIDTQSVKHGSKAVKPDATKNPKRRGYGFVKWVTSADGNTSFDFDNTEIIAATVIYAQWTAFKITEPFKENDVPILVLVGQSNTYGHNQNLPDADKIETPLSNVYGMTRANNNFDTKTKVLWEKYSTDVEFNLGLSDSVNLCNLQNQYAKQWQSHIDAGNDLNLPDLYTVMIATSGRAIDTNTPLGAWASERRNSLFDLAINTFEVMIEQFIAEGKNPRIIAIHWNQWEGDADVSSNNGGSLRAAENYDANIDKIINGFRTALKTLDAHFYFYVPRSIGYDNARSSTPGKTTSAVIRDTILAKARASETIKLMDVAEKPSYDDSVAAGFQRGVFQDAVHYSVETQKWFGEVFFNNMLNNKEYGIYVKEK